MTYYLYFLRSADCGRYYIGTAENLTQRLRQHNSGGVRSTKAYRPWVLVYREALSDKTAARKREYRLKKNFQARKEIIERIEQFGPIV